MVNNIGVTTIKLPRVIGATVQFDTTDEWSSVNMITGDLDLGAIIFDEDGTMGVCSAFSRNDEQNPIYTIRTSTINTQIDIQQILSQSY